MSKYNKGQIYTKYLICVDYLEISSTGFLYELDFDLKHENIKASYTFNRIQFLLDKNHGLSRFAKVFDVIFFNIGKVGELIIRNHREKHFKVSNRIFYTSLLSSVLKIFYEDTQLEFKHIARLDIAIDTIDAIEKLNHLIFDKKLRFKGGIEPKGSINSKTLRFNIEKEITIGSRRSSSFAVIYPKGKKSSTEDKKYVLEYWLTNDLIPIKNVDRFELRLFTKATKKFEIDIFNLNDPEYLVAIVLTSGKNLLSLINPFDGQNNCSRKSVTPLIILRKGNTSIIKKTLSNEYHTTSTFTDRVTIKNLYKRLATTGSITFSEAINEILESNPEYKNWYISKSRSWIKEFSDNTST